MNMIYHLALLLPCGVCLVGAAWLICNKGHNTRSTNFLVATFLFSSLLLLCAANYVAGSLSGATYMWWDILDSVVSMLTIPVMYFYFRSMIHRGRLTWREYLWFIPALVVGGGTAVLYLLMDKTTMEGYIESVLIAGSKHSPYTQTIYKLHQFVSIELYNLMALMLVVGTSVCTILGLRKYHRRLSAFYADTDDKSIYMDKKVLHWFLFAIPLALGLVVPDIQFWATHPPLTALFFVAWAVLYFALFYYGSQKRHTVENLEQDLQQADLHEPKAEPLDSHLPEEVYQRLGCLLTTLIDDDKIYLQSDLRLDEVARLMHTNRAYVSLVIKTMYSCSFSDYINGKRIAFSMELMRQNPSLTQELIAEQSGFLNAQSYSRTFKRQVGSPPKEWSNLHAHR